MITELDLWVAVKAYPVMDASSMSEAVCVAGISASEPRHWLRLFPLDFRSLPSDQRFKKYQRITVRARRPRGDSRPESWTAELDSIRVYEEMGTDAGTWRRRRELVDPLMVPSLCELKRRQAQDKTSLGAFRPKEVTDLVIEPVDPSKWQAKQGLVYQQSLLGDKRETLQPLPVRCRYKFTCDDKGCPGHELSLIDWEMGAPCYRLVRQGKSIDEIGVEMRKLFFDRVCGPDRDVRFVCGNVAAHPTSFLVIGVMWPSAAAVAQPALF